METESLKTPRCCITLQRELNGIGFMGATPVKCDVAVMRVGFSMTSVKEIYHETFTILLTTGRKCYETAVALVVALLLGCDGNLQR